jgi:chemotaxis protein MotB
MSLEITQQDRNLSPDEGDIEEGKGSPAWMTTYGDLMTQLLIFFVMMFALAATLNEMQLNQIKDRLEKYAHENKLESVINLQINEKGLVISLSEKIMFDSGKAEIYEEAKDVLSDISSEIIDIPNNIRVEGHTDSIPIKTDEFPSNWELSSARATNITRFLIEKLQFPPGRLSAGGYGKYHPVVMTGYNREIVNYKNKVIRVPQKHFEKLNKAKTDDEKKEILALIRDEQLNLQRELQSVIRQHLAEANRTAAERAKNRRVDIIVQRISSNVESPVDIEPGMEGAD